MISEVIFRPDFKRCINYVSQVTKLQILKYNLQIYIAHFNKLFGQNPVF